MKKQNEKEKEKEKEEESPSPESEEQEKEESENDSESRDKIDFSYNTKKFARKLSKNFNKNNLYFISRRSIAIIKPDKRIIKSNTNIEIKKERDDKKKVTGIFQISPLKKVSMNYPIENLKPIPIIFSQKKELIYIYLSEEKKDYFLKFLNNADANYGTDIIWPLLTFLPEYYFHMFKNRLEQRLEISMSEKMKHIKPIYTIAIEMDEKFKNCKTVKEQSSKYLFIKKDIEKHIDPNQTALIKFDPFFRIKIKENDEQKDKEPVPKFAVSLKRKLEEMSDDELSDDEFSRRASENIEQINTEDLIDNSNNNTKGEFKKKKYKKEEDEEEEKEKEKNNNDNENEEYKTSVIPYIEYLKKLFYPKLGEFRRTIMEILLENENKDLRIFDTDKMSFQKFICLLEFFITLFTGIQVKYSIDELGFLNMDLYADEPIYMDMAEILHYQLQFQIRDISYSSNEKKQLNQKLIIQLNNVQYEDFLLDKIEFFPPSTAFIQEISNHFRRFDKNDNYHLCQECEKLFTINNYEKATCNSSIFRFIDKARLLTMTLFGIFNVNYLEKMIEKNKDEDDEKKHNLFKGTMLLRNEDVFNEFKLFYIIKVYLSPILTKPILKLNNTFRKIFGEIVGYYYTWVSHYIFWMIFPAVFGLICQILLYFFINEKIQNYIYITFLVGILLWGFYYVRNWKKYEKFYNHIWAMDSFQAEITELYDENYSKVPYIKFLGMKIPKVDKLSALMENFISVALVLTSSLFIMGVNVGIFKINKVDNFLIKYINKFFAYFGISQDISKYTLPILIYIAREIISKIFYKISAILAKLERPTDKEEYEQIVTKKRLTLEFVNYYFNLYYIMLYKKKKNKCENGDCFQELRKQLILILISNISSVFITFVYRIIYMNKNIKNFEIRMKKVYEKNSDYIEKLKFYTRELFKEEEIQKLIIPIIFNFGYIIQFGICCPISFFFMLILIIFIRLTNAISMIYLYYVKTLSISKGFYVYNNTQYLFVFIGIFSNLCILLYTKNSASEIKLIYKLIIIALIQNGVVAICNTIRFKSLPFWFRYRKIIKLKYMKNFGVKTDDSKKDNDDDNNNNINNNDEISTFNFD